MIDVTPVIISIIGLLSVIVTAFLIPLIASKITAAQFEKLLKWLKIGVLAAEQLYKGAKQGVVKKSWVLGFLEENGITYKEETINALLESTVKQLNIDQGK